MSAHRRPAALTLLIGAALVAPVSVQPSAAVQRAFDDVSVRYVDSFVEFQPTYGTTLGDHRLDDRLPNVSTAGRDREIAFETDPIGAATPSYRTKLDRDRQDAALLKRALSSCPTHR